MQLIKNFYLLIVNVSRITAMMLLAVSCLSFNFRKADRKLQNQDFSHLIEMCSESEQSELVKGVGHYFKAMCYASPGFERSDLDSAILHINASRYLDSIELRPWSKWRMKRAGLHLHKLDLISDFIHRKALLSCELNQEIFCFDRFLQISGAPDLEQIALSTRNSLYFEKLRTERDLESVRKFVYEHPNFEKANQARLLLEELIYLEITYDSTHQAYKSYLDIYPEGVFHDQARRNYETILYRSKVSERDPASLAEFIESHPNNPYNKKAQDQLYKLLTPNKTIKELAYFVRKYPHNRNRRKAWSLLFETYTIQATDTIYDQFIAEYPDYPYKKEFREVYLLSKLQLQLFDSNGQFGYIDTSSGDTVIQAAYLDAYPFSEGLAVASKNDCEPWCIYGYINKENEWVIEGPFDYASDFHDGLAIIGQGDCENERCKYGIVDKSGNYIVRPEMDAIFEFSDGLAMVGKRNEGYGYINRNGKIVIDLQYQDADKFINNFAKVMKDSLWQLIGINGKAVNEEFYSAVRNFHEGRAAVSTDGKLWGFIDQEGKAVTEELYSLPTSFIDGKATVEQQFQSKEDSTHIFRQRFIIDITGAVIDTLDTDR